MMDAERRMSLVTEPPVYRFDLNETLYFEKEQEVAEMLEISLDPEISIQTFNEYISIRGVVELRGEYEKKPSEPGEIEALLKLDDIHAKRYMEQVDEKEDGYMTFSHRFPVEISVPAYRVANLDEVTVSIAAFDYELPDGGKLQFQSTVEIEGINDQPLETVELENGTEIEREQASDDSEEVEYAFEFDLKKRDSEVIELDYSLQADDASTDPRLREDSVDMEEDANQLKGQTEEVSHDSVDRLDENLTTDEQQHTKTLAEESSSQELDDAEKDRWKWKEKSQSLSEFFNKESEGEEAALEDSENVSEEYVEETSHTAVAELDDISTGTWEDDEESGAADSSIRYLDGLFERNEEAYTRVRLCIVQEKDTLETIAERYQTSAMHLVNRNRLNEDHVEPGQLLFVPIRNKDE